MHSGLFTACAIVGSLSLVACVISLIVTFVALIWGAELVSRWSLTALVICAASFVACLALTPAS